VKDTTKVELTLTGEETSSTKTNVKRWKFGFERTLRQLQVFRTDCVKVITASWLFELALRTRFIMPPVWFEGRLLLDSPVGHWTG